MTNPTQPPVEQPGVAEQLAMFYVHLKEAEVLEETAAVATTYAIQAKLLSLTRWVAVGWIKEIGSLDKRAKPAQLGRLMPELRHRLKASVVNPRPTLLDWASKALRMGVTQAKREIGSHIALSSTLGVDSQAAALKAQLNVEDRFKRADRVLAVIQGDTHSDVMQGVAVAHGAIGDVERAARWITNRELSNGTAQVASRLNAGLLWVAERDACVHCLAYSGVIAEPEQVFPPDLTFGAHPLTPWPNGVLDRPPLHVNCRCRVTPWLGGDTALPEAMKREARRSILKGWSSESEPNSTRLDAADRLLRKGANLPKTVEQQARAAVRKGHFASRSVPNTGNVTTTDEKG
jgi:hypothetical protein